MFRRGNKYLLYHVFGSIAFLVLPLLLFLRPPEEAGFLSRPTNPHFLFNSLNTIYSPELSGLMRYILRDSNKQMVLLEKELNYINNYIALQRSRLGRTVNINYEMDILPANRMIAPLIMISFIENAFKHGANPDKMAEIIIRLLFKDDLLNLYIKNKKVTNDPINSEGIGLENMRKRLQLLYLSRHQLQIENNEHDFSVQLTMYLT